MLYNNKDLRKVRKYLRNNATPQEVILWRYLRSKNLGYKFRRQTSIGGYVVDFCCPKKNIIIEIDGSQHLDSKEYDEERTRFFESLGFVVLRFWNNEINKDIESVIQKIKDCLNVELPPPNSSLEKEERTT
jgi:very-short-patch-repair endonuclease